MLIDFPWFQLLVAGQPTTATSPPLGAGAGAGGASCAVTAGAVSPGSGGGATGNGAQPQASATSCCENGRPIMTDPVSGHTVCSCQYDSARLALSSYPRLSTSGVGVYGAPYPSTDQNPYPSIGVDSSAFYSPLVSSEIHLSCVFLWLLPLDGWTPTGQSCLPRPFQIITIRLEETSMKNHYIILEYNVERFKLKLYNTVGLLYKVQFAQIWSLWLIHLVFFFSQPHTFCCHYPWV